MKRSSRTAALAALAAIAAIASTMPLTSPARASTPPVKTLDEITIEGEVRLPQVLFITSRESTRPLDWLELYDTDSAESISRGTPFPDRITVIPPAVSADGIESRDVSESVSIEPEASAPPEDPPGSSKEDHR